MFFIQQPIAYYAVHPARQHSGYQDEQEASPEHYYRHLASEHHRLAERALALAQREREQAARQRQLQFLWQRQELARRQAQRRRATFQARYGAHPAKVHPFHFGAIPSEYDHPFQLNQHPPSQQPERTNFASFLTGLLKALAEDMHADLSVERDAHPDRAERTRGVHFNLSGQLAKPQTDVKGKGKARAVEDEPTSRPREGDFFGSWLGALTAGLSDEEQDVILRELGILAPEAPHPVPAREGVAGPSGTKSRPASVEIKRQQAQTAKAQPAPPTPSSPASAHSQSFASIEAIESQYTTLKTNFEFPATLDFDLGSSELAFTPTSAPVKQYENDLSKLLTKLDAVDSDGTESIRGARKALVKVVETELDRVEALKAEAWAEKREERSEAAATATPVAQEEPVQGYDVTFLTEGMETSSPPDTVPSSSFILSDTPIASDAPQAAATTDLVDIPKSLQRVVAVESAQETVVDSTTQAANTFSVASEVAESHRAEPSEHKVHLASESIEVAGATAEAGVGVLQPGNETISSEYASESEDGSASGASEYEIL